MERVTFAANVKSVSTRLPLFNTSLDNPEEGTTISRWRKQVKGGTNMEISARNVLKGRVKKVTPGAVNSEIIVEIAGGVEVASIITKSSAERLGLKPGKAVYAIIKASNVMIGTD
jgi:molybdopterin-binding protein